LNETRHAAWARHLDGIADELIRLAVACDLSLRDPGVIERVLRNDATVCGSANPVAFRKLHRLLIAAFDSLGKAVDRLGPEDTKQITEAIAERIRIRRGEATNQEKEHG
jgi:hypothetical protein